MSSRNFVISDAVRKQVPLLVGLVGPSGGGKTFSALRLATGFQKVMGGDIFYIDTEANRALHYSDKFKFKHLPFGAPFSPLDYLEAIEACAKQGAKNIIIDSMSLEHEGTGGVLEMHEAELSRISKGDDSKRDKANFLAWAKPKAERRKLINSILQMPINYIFCFRSKEKLRMTPGRPPEALGWQPIAGEEYIYETTLNCLLLPNAGGVPTWNPDEKAEKQMVKLPGQFKSFFKDGQPLSEEIGVKLAEWARGGTPEAPKASGDTMGGVPIVVNDNLPNEGMSFTAVSYKGMDLVIAPPVTSAQFEGYLRDSEDMAQLKARFTEFLAVKGKFNEGETADVVAAKEETKHRLTGAK